MPDESDMRPRTRSLLCVALTVVSYALRAETGAFDGYWLEPKGSVLRIDRCGDKMCVEIVTFSPGDHPHVDLHNPDPALRTRSLCGVRIGEGFVEKDARHADGGHLYDPRTGRTYSGSMMVEGDLLKLRGYVGIKLLGRSETWTRVQKIGAPCQQQQ
jgi:uncharacterized protein (DUF2147 family)